MRCVVTCGSTSVPLLAFFMATLLWRFMIHKHTGRWMWQGSASVVFLKWKKLHLSFQTGFNLSLLLSWRIFQPWNPRQIQLSPDTALWFLPFPVHQPFLFFNPSLDSALAYRLFLILTMLFPETWASLLHAIWWLVFGIGLEEFLILHSSWDDPLWLRDVTVSYTHLTLPTRRTV